MTATTAHHGARTLGSPRPGSGRLPRWDWGAERVDLGAYFARIGVSAPPTSPSAATLALLHRAHVTTIPFENLDVMLGRGIDLNLDAVQRKLVGAARGGYCFEHNLLFAAVLERLEYPVARLAARVSPDRPGPRTHQMLTVWSDGRWWLADVGFGGQVLDPIPLAATSVRQGEWTYRLAPSRVRPARIPPGGDAWRLQAPDRDGGWDALYEFTTDPIAPIDAQVHNHFTATHPSSPFVGQVVAFRTAPDRRDLLRGRELTVVRPSGETRTRTLTADQAVAALGDTFDVHLDADDTDRLHDLLQEA